MAQVTITINAREYAVACDDGQEARIIKLSRMLDDKAKQLTAGGGHINENMLLAMVGLLMADDLFEANKKLEQLSQNALPQNVQAAEPSVPAVQTVEKVVEKIVERPADTIALDEELAGVIKQVTEQIKMLANQIESM